MENYIDTSNFSTDTIFPLDPGKNEKCFGYLKFENGEWPCFEFNSKAAKTYEDKRINQLRSIKAKRIKSKSLKMTIEDVEKDVIQFIQTKENHF